ncbi:hypothetical protein BGX26_001337 [Mortierella sp. AD094]|nr:hypothetical protein BGX26_001337 [Mortierella sp. AD094]
MTTFENGIYNITRDGNQSLTTFGNQSSSAAILGEPSFAEGVEKWELTRNDDGTVSLRDVKSQLFLSLDDVDNIRYHQTVQLDEREYRWRLTEGPKEGEVYIQPVGQSEDGEDFIIDQGMLCIYPPRMTLMLKDERNEYQGWSFSKYSSLNPEKLVSA